MKTNFRFQFVFDFDEEISAVNYGDFIVSKLAEKGIDVAQPIYSSEDGFVAIFKDKISDK